MSEQFISRWGHPKADDTGWLYVPGWIMANYHKFTDKDGNQVGLTSAEFQFMCQVMSFKFDMPGSKASPSLPTVAERMGIALRNAQRIKKTLVEKGALSITEQAGKPHIYDFSKLTAQCYAAFEESLTHDVIITPDDNVTPDNTIVPTHDNIVTPPMTISSPEYIEVKDKKENIEVKSVRVEEKRKTAEIIPFKPEPVKGTPQGAAKAQYHEQLKMAWGDKSDQPCSDGKARTVFKHMFGLSQESQEYPIDCPLGINDIFPFARWYRDKNGEGIKMPSRADTIESWVHDYWEYVKNKPANVAPKPYVPEHATLTEDEADDLDAALEAARKNNPLKERAS